MKKLTFAITSLIIFASCQKNSPKVDQPATISSTITSTEKVMSNVTQVKFSNTNAEVYAIEKGNGVIEWSITKNKIIHVITTTETQDKVTAMEGSKFLYSFNINHENSKVTNMSIDKEQSPFTDCMSAAWNVCWGSKVCTISCGTTLFGYAGCSIGFAIGCGSGNM